MFSKKYRIQCNINPTYKFPIKGDNSIGVIALVKNPDHIDKERAQSVLVESFITEYQKYLLPHEISNNLTSWRNGDQSVRQYYENYFKIELDDFFRGNVHYWVQATINGTLAGWATFQREASEHSSVYMNLLVVHPEYQQKGIGGQLVNALIKLNEIPELNAIHLLLRKKNKGGRAFYTKLLFTPNPEYKREDNFVDMNLLEPLTWRNPALQNEEEIMLKSAFAQGSHAAKTLRNRK
jgi:GNAT superfamily N-acetyltransferase